MKLAEQNRNQLTFGAGVSQYEGVFGQLAFQTSNFLGRGESLTVKMTAGDRSQNYQLAFTEPYLFDRNITGGFDFFKRSLDYIGYYTQKSAGGNLIFGFPVANFSRMFFSYSYESVKITNLNEALIDQSCLLRATGCATISSVGDLSQLTRRSASSSRRNPVRPRLAAARTGRQPDGQQGGAELRPQHRRQPDLPERGQEAHRRHRSGGARRQYASTSSRASR